MLKLYYWTSLGNIFLLFPEQARLLASCTIETEKLFPGPGLEPGPLALRAGALTSKLSRTSTDP